MNVPQPHPGRRFLLHIVYAVLLVAVCAYFALHPHAAAAQQPASASATLLDHTQASAVMPATVFYRGQSATIQGRNSAGIRFPGDRYLLAAIVDTGGYATAIAQTYQAYLITENPVTLGDKQLAPGAYGFGFIDGDRMVLMDLGGNRLFETPTTRDPSLKRPSPLQILAAPGNSAAFRLYLGRSFILITAAR